MAQDVVKKDKAIIEPGCKSLFALGAAGSTSASPLTSYRFTRGCSHMRALSCVILLALTVVACAEAPRSSPASTTPPVSLSTQSPPRGLSRPSTPGSLYDRQPWTVNTRISPVAGAGRICSAIVWGEGDRTSLQILVHQIRGETRVTGSFANAAWDVPRATEQVATVRFNGQALSVPVLGQDDQIHLEMMLWPDRGREFLRRLANAANVNLALRSGANLSLDTVGARPALEALGLCETVHFGSRLISRAVSPSGTQNPMAR